MAYEIDDNVPVPTGPPAGASKGQYGEMRTAMRKLKVGQSIVLYGDNESERARSNVTRERHDNGKKWLIRKDVKNPGFYRLWRTR